MTSLASSCLAPRPVVAYQPEECSACCSQYASALRAGVRAPPMVLSACCPTRAVSWSVVISPPQLDRQCKHNAGLFDHNCGMVSHQSIWELSSGYDIFIKHSFHSLQLSLTALHASLRGVLATRLSFLAVIWTRMGSTSMAVHHGAPSGSL